MEKIKLDDIVNQLEHAGKMHSSYFDKNTGEILTIPEELERLVEEGLDDEEFLSEQEKELLPAAKDIVSNPGKYLILPDRFDIDEYSLMEDFCTSIEDAEVKNKMFMAIQGRGAFGRFKRNIRAYRLVREWYRFRHETIQKIAIKWCEENNVEFYTDRKLPQETEKDEAE